jgi:hypothetical protein
LYPIVTSQYSSTTLYLTSDHIQSLFSKVTIGVIPTLAAETAGPPARNGSQIVVPAGSAATRGGSAHHSGVM